MNPFSTPMLAIVPSGSSLQTFALFAGLLLIGLTIGAFLRVRFWALASFAILTGALLLAIGLWRERAGHPGLGTIARTAGGRGLDGHGSAGASPEAVATFMALGLALGTFLLLRKLRPHLTSTAGRPTAPEWKWSLWIAALWAITTYALRFDALTRLHTAAAHGNSARVASILAEQPELADQTHFGIAALWRAADAGEATTVAALLAAGASPTPQHFVGTALGFEQPYLQAAAGGHVEAARLLLRAGKPNASELTTSETPQLRYLHRAASSGNLEIVRLLLDEGADVNALAPVGGLPETALYFARTAKITALLLERGADATIGRPLHGAVRGETDGVRQLIAAGAALDAIDSRGCTALGIARMEAAQVLIAAGASLEIGHPLHWAVRCTETGTVKALLAANADPLALDDDGKRPDAYTKLDVILDLLKK